MVKVDDDAARVMKTTQHNNNPGNPRRIMMSHRLMRGCESIIIADCHTQTDPSTRTKIS
jgi:hemin uptake protein HemP